MRWVISAYTLLITVCYLNAATWTIHGAKDNWLGVSGSEGHFTCNQFPYNAIGNNGDDKPVHLALAYWDFDWDVFSPPDAYSGVTDYTNQCPGDYTVAPVSVGWAEVQVLDGDFWEVRFSMSGPYPDYIYTDQVGLLPLAGGEYWIDFDSTGVSRVSTSPPCDFGKWSWNGSINPSFVDNCAPLAKKRGKGHRR